MSKLLGSPSKRTRSGRGFSSTPPRNNDDISTVLAGLQEEKSPAKVQPSPGKKDYVKLLSQKLAATPERTKDAARKSLSESAVVNTTTTNVEAAAATKKKKKRNRKKKKGKKAVVADAVAPTVKTDEFGFPASQQNSHLPSALSTPTKQQPASTETKLPPNVSTVTPPALVEEEPAMEKTVSTEDHPKVSPLKPASASLPAEESTSPTATSRSIAPAPMAPESEIPKEDPLFHTLEMARQDLENAVYPGPLRLPLFWVNHYALAPLVGISTKVVPALTVGFVKPPASAVLGAAFWSVKVLTYNWLPHPEEEDTKQDSEQANGVVEAVSQ